MDAKEDPGAEFPGNEGAEDVGDEDPGGDDDDPGGGERPPGARGADLAHVHRVHRALYPHAQPAQHPARVQHRGVLGDGQHTPAGDARHHRQQHGAWQQTSDLLLTT